MKILVVSDTHGDCSRVIEVFQKLNNESPVDIIAKEREEVQDTA